MKKGWTSIVYYEEMLEQEAINKYLNMIANDYNGELAKTFQEKYINKDKEIERLNNILNELEEYLQNQKDEHSGSWHYREWIRQALIKLQELKGEDK